MLQHSIFPISFNSTFQFFNLRIKVFLYDTSFSNPTPLGVHWTHSGRKFYSAVSLEDNIACFGKNKKLQWNTLHHDSESVLMIYTVSSTGKELPRIFPFFRAVFLPLCLMVLLLPLWYSLGSPLQITVPVRR